MAALSVVFKILGDGDETWFEAFGACEADNTYVLVTHWSNYTEHCGRESQADEPAEQHVEGSPIHTFFLGA